MVAQAMTTSSTFFEVKSVLTETLQLGVRGETLTESTKLLDDIPEFDSMAVVTVVTAIEERFDIAFDDEELTADQFETVGTLVNFVASKRGS